MRNIGRRRGVRSRLALCLGLTLAMQLAVLSPAYAEENIIGPSGTGYTKSRWDQLMDDVLEYDEIPDLVHEFNHNISEIWSDLQDVQSDMERYIEDLESDELKIKNLRDKAEDDGDAVTAATHEMQLKGVSLGSVSLPSFGSILRTLKESASSLTVARSTVNSIKKGENQITMAAQSLMITYDGLLKQKEMLDMMADLYERQYQIVLNKQSLGMATEQEVYAAQVNQLSAASMSASLSEGLLQLRPTICTLTGWAADASPEFAKIPEVDLSLIDAMDLEQDTRKAIGNNTTLIVQRTSEKGKTMDGVKARLDYINEGEEKMTIKMKSLYDDVQSKRTAFEAAKDGYEAAQKERDKYERMYGLGYLSESDYLGTQISFCQSEAAYDTACTDLRLAVETYNWAIKGLVDPE